ncbi:MAG: hypothetical protein K2Q97_20335 [Burkholderiaceae bacterium]|nr:hypothetical protein [Burkholderiaceae bacterium]
MSQQVWAAQALESFDAVVSATEGFRSRAGQRLMAHLSLVRLSLARPWVTDAGPVLTDSLAQTHRALTQLLANPQAATTGPTEGSATAPVFSPWSNGLDMLPLAAPDLDRLPWLQRRLGVLQKDAQAVQQAAWALSRPRT